MSQETRHHAEERDVRVVPGLDQLQEALRAEGSPLMFYFQDERSAVCRSGVAFDERAIDVGHPTVLLRLGTIKEGEEQEQEEGGEAVHGRGVVVVC